MHVVEKVELNVALRFIMDRVINLHYREPHIYELANPHGGYEQARMIADMFRRFRPAAPRSILDLGCGTGRDLSFLARECPDCYGIDCVREMVEYAKKNHPTISFAVGDMRSVRLGRHFDAIICVGSTLMYALSNHELHSAFKTFAAHSHPGTILVLGLRNAGNMLANNGALESKVTVYDYPEFRGKSTAHYHLDHHQQQLVRRREWELADRIVEDDYCRYRLLFPLEIDLLLEESGFQVRGKFDNLQLAPSDLSGWRLYVSAIRMAHGESISIAENA